MARLLLADDAADIRLLVRAIFSVDSAMEVVGEAATPEEAIRLAGELQPDVVILDQGFGGTLTGLDVAPTIKKTAPGARIILFTAYQDVEQIVADTPEVDAFVLKTNAHLLVSVANDLLYGEG